MKLKKWINMIDEYLTEPHSIDKEWVESLKDYRKLLVKELAEENQEEESVFWRG